MLPLLFFVMIFGFVNSKEVFCDYNEKYCHGRKHVLCVIEPKTEATSSDSQIKPTTVKTVNSPNSVEATTSFPDKINPVENDSMATAGKMMRHPEDKKSCESACFETDTIHVIDVLCQTDKNPGPDYVCDYAGYGMNCIKFTEVTMIEKVDYVSIIQDYQIIILYILLFGIFFLNFTICAVVNTLSRYY